MDVSEWHDSVISKLYTSYNDALKTQAKYGGSTGTPLGSALTINIQQIWLDSNPVYEMVVCNDTNTTAGKYGTTIMTTGQIANSKTAIFWSSTMTTRDLDINYECRRLLEDNMITWRTYAKTITFVLDVRASTGVFYSAMSWSTNPTGGLSYSNIVSGIQAADGICITALAGWIVSAQPRKNVDRLIASGAVARAGGLSRRLASQASSIAASIVGGANVGGGDRSATTRVSAGSSGVVGFEDYVSWGEVENAADRVKDM